MRGVCFSASVHTHSHALGEVMTDEMRPAGTRQFSTIAEIESYPGFLPDNPVSLERYASIVGPYSLNYPTEQMACCVQNPGGGLCRQGHGKGWMVKLKDESASIIGVDCAEEKFGVDSSVFHDIKRAINEIDRLDTEARLQELLATRDMRFAEIDRVIDRLEQVEIRISAIRDELGRVGWQALEFLQRAGSGQVAARGITPTKRDPDGDIIQYEINITVPIGTVTGIAACAPGAVSGQVSNLRALRMQYAGAERALADNQNRAFKEINATLADHPRRIADATALIQAAAALDSNNFAPLCYVICDKAERIRVAKVALARMGKPGGKDPARDWLSESDRLLCEKHNVRHIRPDR